MSLVVRTNPEPSLVVPSLKAAIRAVHPQLGTVATLNDLIALTR